MHECEICSSMQVMGNVNSISEQRAKIICDEVFKNKIKFYTQEAYLKIKDREQAFESKLIDKLKDVEGALNSFADPQFQYLLSETHRAVVSTDRKSDYDILSELLLKRIESKEDRYVMVGIHKAIEIVDEISDEALLGLSLAFMVEHFSPVIGFIELGISSLNSLYGSFDVSRLPQGNTWIDHLDMLNTIRRSVMGSFVSSYEHIVKALSGYYDVGIKKSSKNYYTAIDLLKDIDFSKLLIEHELNSDYVRLPIVNRDSIQRNDVYLYVDDKIERKVKLIRWEFTERERQVLLDVYDLYEDNASIRSSNKQKLISMMNDFDNINVVCEWWNKIPYYFDITASGKVLAHANIKRVNDSIPDFFGI